MWLVFKAIFHPTIPGNIPYIVYLLSGVVAVTYFQQGVSMTGASMAASAGMLTKVYVPPVVFAWAAAVAGAVNFLLGVVPLVILQAVVGPRLPWTFLLVPLPLLFLLGLITGLGLLIATLQIQFNDILDLTNVFLTLIAWVTPTFYPISIVGARYQKLFYLNPLYSFVVVFRYLEYGSAPPNAICVAIVIGSGVVTLAIGLMAFVRRWPKLAAQL
jgi:ABC-type polysaccharide/polyol phosphate export permease